MPELFGTFNPSTATANEVTLSKTFQTAIANFIKNPNESPAPNWPKYIPGSLTQTLARLAYVGNVETDNFVQPAISDSQVNSFALLDLPSDADIDISRILPVRCGIYCWMSRFELKPINVVSQLYQFLEGS